MEIKICGLTKEIEAEYLNAANVDYAGFVFFEKSKRNITIEQAKRIGYKLAPSIRKVAVTVSPDIKLVNQIETAGFDILQVHKELSREVLEAVHIPVWYAFNVTSPGEMPEQQFLQELPKELSDKIEAIVVDGAQYGSGKTFDWKKGVEIKQSQQEMNIFANRKFVLAGGLNPENVAEGIRIFEPDIVDVSSGVEEAGKKDEQRILSFVQQVCK